LESRLATATALLTSSEKGLAGHDKNIEASRARWIAVNGEVFSGGACPTCGQQLPFDQLQAATAAFEKQKRARLDEIMRTANSQKDAKAQAEERIKSLRDEIAVLDADILRLDGQISAADAAKITPVDMDGYADAVKAIQARVSALNAELSSMMGNASQTREQLRSELSAVQAQISQQQAIVGKESVLQYANNRIADIQADARNAAQALESIEKMLYLADEYTRYKTQYVESSVNSLFRITRFRLFREQANGGVEERCDVVYDGVPYIGLNNGMKINVGIDIINALSRHYGVTVPLFVDNAEGVTRLEQSDAQVIRLFVSESDKELRCVNEN
jgi:DNA repair exonuclease SbcCD ATPase subunit